MKQFAFILAVMFSFAALTACSSNADEANETVPIEKEGSGPFSPSNVSAAGGSAPAEPQGGGTQTPATE